MVSFSSVEKDLILTFNSVHDRILQMNKKELLEIFTQELRKIDGGASVFLANLSDPYIFKHSVHENVYPRYIYLDEVNDFPLICFYVSQETRTHIGGGVKYANLLVNLRTYVNSEDPNEETEDLIDDIDHVIKYITQVQPCFVECRVISTSTDEGIMAPVGVGEMNIEMIYLLEE